MNLKAIIIEDEEDVQLILNNMITRYCKEVEVVATVDRVSKAIQVINHHQPDIVFLDIELPQENGFALFDYFTKPNFEVIFTTAYTQYAIKAIQLSAIGYLLKPIDLEDLRKAIKAVRKRKALNITQKKIEILRDNLNSRSEKLVLSTQSGYSFVELKNILYCQSQGNYTAFFLFGNKKILVSKTLKLYADILEGFNFFRVSRSHLININHIKEYGRSKNPSIKMADDTIIPISLSRRDDFLKILNKIN